MQSTYQQNAIDLLNYEVSDDDILDCSPIKQSIVQNSIPQDKTSQKKPQGSSVKGPPKATSQNTAKKSSSTKTGKDAKKNKDKELQEEQAKQLQWYQDEYVRLKEQKKALKEERTQYLLTINTYKTKLEQSVQNEKKLLRQLNEQLDLTKQALKQSNDAQINLEQLKHNQLQQKQIDESQKQRQKEEMEYQYQKKLDNAIKQAILEVEHKYEMRAHQMNKELDLLRLENVELHRKSMQNDSSRKQQFVLNELDQLKSKYQTVK